MRRHLSSLRFRLLILALLAVIPALVLLTYTALREREWAAAGAQESALRLARLTANNQEQMIESARQLLMVLAELPAVRNADAETCSRFMDSQQALNPHYTFIGVVDRNGYILCGTGSPPSSISIGSDSLVQYTFEDQDFAVGDYRIAPDGSAVLGFGYPVRDAQGEAHTMLVASVDLTWLNRLVDASLMPQGTELTMTDRYGTIVAHLPNADDWVGRQLPEPVASKIMGQTHSEGTFEATDVKGVRRLYAFSVVRQRQRNVIHIGVGIPVSVAYASANQLYRQNLILLGLVAVLALVAVWVGGDAFLVRHVRALLSATNRLSAGDYAARTGRRYGVDELSQLAASFDAMAAALQQREAERNQAQAELIQKEQARAELLHKVITAQEDERVRIARELHDETSQSLVMLMVGLDQAAMALPDDPKKAADCIGTTRFIAEGMVDNIHKLIEDLRPALLDVLGLESAIVSYAEERLKPLGIALHFDTDGLEHRLPPPVNTALFRIAQEALTNVVRHAGASTVEVSLHKKDGTVTLQVRDNGQGFDPARRPATAGFGLMGMQERVSILGGQFRIESAPGHGTCIHVRVPIPDQEASREQDSRPNG